MTPSRTPSVDALLAASPHLCRCDVCDGIQTLDRGDRDSEVSCWRCDGAGVFPTLVSAGGLATRFAPSAYDAEYAAATGRAIAKLGSEAA